MILMAGKKDTAPAGPQEGTPRQWEHVFGGQAVMEGVMMRGRYSWGLAVRRPSGGIARFSYALTSAGDRHRWLKLPVVRGVVALFESLSLGVKALGISANVALEGTEPDSPGNPGGAAADGGADAGADAIGSTSAPAFG